MPRLGLQGLGLLSRHNADLVWMPRRISGCILHLRGDLGITLNGSDVSAWADQSGSKNHATQGTAADQPAFEATGGPNSTPCVTFDAANTEWMDLTGLSSLSNDYTVFAVINMATVASAAQQLLSSSLTSSFALSGSGNTRVGLVDSGPWVLGQEGLTGNQILAYRLTSGATTAEMYRDGVVLASPAYSGGWSWGAAPTLGIYYNRSNHPFNGKLAEIIVYNRALTDVEVAVVHAYLAARYAIAFSPLSIANCGAWWDLDHATQAGGILTGVTDRALAQTINVVGSPAIVSIGGQDFVRFDGTDDVLWIADAAALDGANGSTHILKHANCESLPIVAALASKGRSAVHFNGRITGNGSAGTRFSVAANGLEANAGPLAEFSTPAETIAMAIESGVAVRRVDGDGTYASTPTVITTSVGAGSLVWGGRDHGVGPVFAFHFEADLRAALYYNRPLNQYELIAARNYLEAV